MASPRKVKQKPRAPPPPKENKDDDEPKPQVTAHSNLQAHLMAGAAAIVLLLALYAHHHLSGMEEEWKKPKPTDVFIVSYPKSGNTFVRLFLGHLSINGRNSGSHQLDLQTLEDVVPDLEYGPNRKKYVTTGYTAPDAGPGPTGSVGSSPRFFKSHQGFGLHYEPPCDQTIGSKNVEEYQCDCPNCPVHMRRIVYVVRGGRDVLCSYYHFQTKLGEFVPTPKPAFSTDGSGDGAFSEFLRRDAEEPLYPGVRWIDHVWSYVRQAHNTSKTQDIHFVRYEDLRHPATALKTATRLAKWAGLPSHPQAVKDALERSGFDKIRELEDKHGLKLFDKHYDKRDKDFRMTRKGEVGGWADDPECQLPEGKSKEFNQTVDDLEDQLAPLVAVQFWNEVLAGEGYPEKRRPNVIRDNYSPLYESSGKKGDPAFFW